MLENGDFKFYDANGLKIDNLSHTYDGTAYTPAKTVFDTANTKVKKYDNSNWESVGTLTEGTDYEIKYVDNTYGKKDSSGQKQYGVVLAIAKGTYGGNYTDSTTRVFPPTFTTTTGLTGSPPAYTPLATEILESLIVNVPISNLSA